METKTINLDGKELTLLRHKKAWVFPEITTYSHGLGSSVAIILRHWDGIGLDYYMTITVNLPLKNHNTECQYINTNNNGDDILDWLEEYGFGKRTGNEWKSGSCVFPEINFSCGEKFKEYKKASEELFGK